MTEHEDLIARLRNRSGMQTADVNERVALMDEAADVLEKVTAECDQLAAVVHYLRLLTDGSDWNGGQLDDILKAAPSVALNHVKAEALREAADDFEGGTISVEIFGGSAEARYWQGANEARGNLVASMRERADGIERGESNA